MADQGELFNGSSYTDKRRIAARDITHVPQRSSITDGAVGPEGRPTAHNPGARQARGFNGETVDPNQGFMFATYNDLVDRGYVPNHFDVAIDDFNRAREHDTSPLDAMYDRKFAESQTTGLTSRLLAEGIKSPIGLLSGQEVESRQEHKFDSHGWPVVDANGSWQKQTVYSPYAPRTMPLSENMVMQGGHRLAVERRIQQTQGPDAPQRYFPVSHASHPGEAVRIGEDGEFNPHYEEQHHLHGVEGVTDHQVRRITDIMGADPRNTQDFPDIRMDKLVTEPPITIDTGRVRMSDRVYDEAPRELRAMHDGVAKPVFGFFGGPPQGIRPGTGRVASWNEALGSRYGYASEPRESFYDSYPTYGPSVDDDEVVDSDGMTRGYKRLHSGRYPSEWDSVATARDQYGEVAEGRHHGKVYGFGVEMDTAEQSYEVPKHLATRVQQQFDRQDSREWRRLNGMNSAGRRDGHTDAARSQGFV